ncbi:hypothetical protein [Lentzea sp. NBRC 102530]|uniref:hypothetical protein n=1 Tax=Lentzea sp. NBRC 102530 TaxID=3032201 RepID=UPI0024A4B798|nr:hypothetical protein [Lentzea sp. NBRC 102530]GLY50240.1 hypothetical protein Lesp01_38960 [Lentzea sp. NBRC 102530]
MSSCPSRVVPLRTPLSEDQRLSLVEQTVLCHPAVHSVELTSGEEIRAEVVVWRGSSPERTAHDLAAALNAVLTGVSVSVGITAVAYRRRSTTLFAVYK